MRRNGEGMKEIKQLLFLDCETTGLDETTDEIVEVAGALVDLQTREVMAHCSHLVQHTKPIGFQPERWEAFNWNEAWPLHEAMTNLAHLMNGQTIAGQNPGFDVRFIRAAMARCGIPYPETDYHLVDVSSMAIPLVMAKRVEGISLRHTRLWAGCTGEQTHRAFGDVVDTIEVFFKLCDTFNLGLATQHELDLALSNLQPMTCPDCGGKGLLESNSICHTCKGTGSVIRPRL